ncbi:MAG: S9 family peptidase [Ignavibacteria bacterium]|nr:S9 family peptidase [Ignavibacteria bacterium]
MKHSSLLLAACVLILLLPGCKGTDEARGVKQYTIEQFMDTEAIGGASFSYDEKLILYSSKKTGIYNAFTIPVDGGAPMQLTDSKDNSIFVISFLPKDNRILYRSDKGGNEIYHIYLRNEDGTVKDLTPDEKSRAQFYQWTYDKKGFFFGWNKRDPKFMDVYEMDLVTLVPWMVYRNDKGYDYAVSSTEKRYIAFSKSSTTSNSDMYLYDQTTQSLKHLSPHRGDVQYSPAFFSRDSKALYFLTDDGSEFSCLKKYDITSGTIEKVEEAPWDIMYADLSRSGRYRIIGINNDAKTEIKIHDNTTGEVVALPKLPNAEITAVRISDSEKLMSFYVNGSRSPNNLCVYNLETKQYKQLTNTMNPEINADDLIEAEVVRYKSFDGVEIPSVYYRPHQVKEGGKTPALVWVHGGPGGQSRVGYSPLIQYLVNHGYAIIAVNNRGSSGYGKSFYKMDDLKHGSEDLADCVEAKKFLGSTGYVDTNKIGIIGGSYGGYMVCAALTFRPTEFAVGVNLFGVTNWVRTLKSIPPWWESMRNALYQELGDPFKQEEFLKAKSPLFHAEKIQRPFIVLQGANDPRVLKVESDEIVEAAKKNGVPVEYLVFPDEGHGFVKKENEIRGYKAILEFLEKSLKGSTGA